MSTDEIGGGFSLASSQRPHRGRTVAEKELIRQ
jgi:hypothetical protein